MSLEGYIQNFFGYGNLDSDLWFIGMEEGGGNSKEEIELRIKAWEKMGGVATVDLVEFHDAIGQGDYFSGKGKLQRTWTKLIRFCFALQGKPPAQDTLREFQKTQLGQRSSKNAILELLPLPSPGLDQWHYSEFFDLEYLRSRETYAKRVLPDRILALQRLRAAHKPKIVLFYGLQYLTHWSAIAESDFDSSQDGGAYFTSMNGTLFIAAKHPASFVPKGYFERLAENATKRLRPN